jgi:hypothetical protein
MGTTANNGWPYPESTDFVADGATAIENLADAIDADFPSTIPGWLISCNGGGSPFTYNPADVSNAYYAAGAYAGLTMTTGTSVLIIITAVWNHVAGKTDNYSVNITGASTIGPSDDRSVWYTGPDSQVVTASHAFCQTLTAGSNTFKINGKHQSGAYAQTVQRTRLQVIRLN